MKTSTLLLSLALMAGSAAASPIAYVMLADGQFGTMDLSTGAFNALGAPCANPSGIACNTTTLAAPCTGLPSVRTGFTGST